MFFQRSRNGDTGFLCVGFEIHLNTHTQQRIPLADLITMDIQFLRKALAAGKHVLCEKSITLNSGELEEAMQLAREHGVVLAEAMTIYLKPFPIQYL